MLNKRNQDYQDLHNILLEEFNILMVIVLENLQNKRNEISQRLVQELITLNLTSSTQIKVLYSKENQVLQSQMEFQALVNISSFLDLLRRDHLHTQLQENQNDQRVL